MTRRDEMEGMLAALQLREAVASVSLSHEDSCVCDTCRAALGDPEAMARISQAVSATAEARRREEGES